MDFIAAIKTNFMQNDISVKIYEALKGFLYYKCQQGVNVYGPLKKNCSYQKFRQFCFFYILFFSY